MENAENAGSLQDEIFTEQSTEQIALRAENLRKTFRLSAKQRKSEKRRNLRFARPERRGKNHNAPYTRHAH